MSIYEDEEGNEIELTEEEYINRPFNAKLTLKKEKTTKKPKKKEQEEDKDKFDFDGDGDVDADDVSLGAKLMAKQRKKNK